MGVQGAVGAKGEPGFHGSLGERVSTVFLYFFMQKKIIFFVSMLYTLRNKVHFFDK